MRTTRLAIICRYFESVNLAAADECGNRRRRRATFPPTFGTQTQGFKTFLPSFLPFLPSSLLARYSIFKSRWVIPGFPYSAKARESFLPIGVYSRPFAVKQTESTTNGYERNSMRRRLPVRSYCYFFATFAQLSRSVIVRLKTGLSSVESASMQKYPSRSN